MSATATPSAASAGFGAWRSRSLIRRAEGVRRAAARYPGLQVVETAHHRETPQDAVAEVLRVDAAHPDLVGWAMVGGWPLFRSSQTARFMEEIQRRNLKVVAVDALPEQLIYVERPLRVDVSDAPSWGTYRMDIRLVHRVSFALGSAGALG